VTKENSQILQQTLWHLRKPQTNLISLWKDLFTIVGYNIGQVETLLGCINRHHCVLIWTGFIVNTNGGNRIRTCYSVTRLDYLIIKLVIVYRWYENLRLEWNKSFLFHFFHKLFNIISFFSSRKKAIISSFVCFQENKGIMLQTFREKQKYQVTNVGVEKITSRLLHQHIWIYIHTYEFKMNEIERKTPQ